MNSPSGTRNLFLNTTQDCVLGEVQVAPSGLDLQSLSFPVLTGNALYQGTTLVGPLTPNANLGFQPLGFSLCPLGVDMG
jgi:hypothetical protein